jgi:hypothetical protein
MKYKQNDIITFKGCSNEHFTIIRDRGNNHFDLICSKSLSRNGQMYNSINFNARDDVIMIKRFAATLEDRYNDTWF